MQAGEGLSLAQIQAFLEASDEVQFEGRNREEVYEWVGQTLRQQGYERLGRASRGWVRRYLEKMTGLSRAQVTRLITPYLGGEQVQPKQYRRRRFPIQYTRAGGAAGIPTRGHGASRRPGGYQGGVPHQRRR